MNDMNFHMNHIKLFQFVVVFVVISVSPNLKGPIKNTHLLDLLPQTKINNFYLHLHTPKVFFANSTDVVEGKNSCALMPYYSINAWSMWN
jgi:hypothetical protein